MQPFHSVFMLSSPEMLHTLLSWIHFPSSFPMLEFLELASLAFFFPPVLIPALFPLHSAWRATT